MGLRFCKEFFWCIIEQTDIVWYWHYICIHGVPIMWTQSLTHVCVSVWLFYISYPLMFSSPLKGTLPSLTLCWNYSHSFPSELAAVYLFNSDLYSSSCKTLLWGGIIVGLTCGNMGDTVGENQSGLSEKVFLCLPPLSFSV